MRRVVITGVGVISSLGRDFSSFTKNLMDAVCAIGPITNIPTDNLTARNGGEVKNPVDTSLLDPKAVGMMDRASVFACIAAKQALADSGYQGAPERIACIVGTGIGGMNTVEEGYARLYQQGTSRLHPLTVPKIMTSAPASQVSMTCNLKGPSFVTSSACASANHAIGMAYYMVKSGMADAAVTGGTEACMNFGTIRAWEALRVMAPDVCRPFAKGRPGMSIGEGSAMFVIETLESAQQRGAKIYGEIAGFGQSADAGDITSPDPDGCARAMRAALEEADLQPGDVQYINAHGTGTTVNDNTETAVIKTVFGDHAKNLAVSSTKSQTGHALGAAGAIELAAVVAALQEQKAPPTVNLNEPDPQCDLDYVPNAARVMKIDAALSNSFAFGGLNAVLAVRKI
ncbi:MAG: beta-ketoacyl synthase [Bdellovibrionales bacterium]